MSGRVESITTDWRGDTLAVPTAAIDTVLTVRDTTDFDEDGGWLTIVDAAAVEYLTVDHDANTVTLAAAVGAAYEAGCPVVIWDPTVPPFGAKVVEYVATVMTDRGAVAAVIPHAVIPTSGVENLIGASVGLDEDEDGEWFVSQVYGREAIIDPSSLGSPIFQATLTSDTPNVTTSTLTPIDDWVPNTYDTTDYSYNATTGELTLLREGLYDLVVYVKWTPATSGRRETSIMSYATSGGASKEEIVFTAAPSDNGTITQVVPLKYESNMTKGRPILRVEVWQNTGAGLSVRGSASENLTMWQVVRLR